MRKPTSHERRPRRRSGSGGRAPARAHGPAVEPLHPTEVPPDIENFRAWQLAEPIQAAIDAMGIVTPTPIQKLAIGPVLEGKDVIAKAETGTGKTLAFGAPMMSKIDPARASVLGLVLCPTRELAEQVAKVLTELGKPRGIKVALIVGGEPSGPQVAALKAGSQVVVGTPGRVLDLYQQKFLSFPWTEFVVLDEADVMLEIGFIDDVKRILSLTPDERQTLLFSATFPAELLKLAREYTRTPAEVATASGVATVDTIEQSWMQVDEEDRPLALIRLIEQSEADDVFLVFCDRRTDVDRLMRRLERMPFSVKALHGGYEQDARFRVMSAFRTGEVKALVATDVASRGLDVAHVTHVVNYGVPHDITDYTHRIGRTGRAGRKGSAITIVSHTNAHKWKRIARDARWPIPEIPPPSGRRERAERSERPGRAARSERPERRERDEHTRRHGRDESAPRHAQAESPERRHAPRHAEPPPRERAAWPVDTHPPRPHGDAAQRSRAASAPRAPSPAPHRSEAAQRDATRDDGRREPRRGSERARTPRGDARPAVAHEAAHTGRAAEAPRRTERGKSTPHREPSQREPAHRDPAHRGEHARHAPARDEARKSAPHPREPARKPAGDAAHKPAARSSSQRSAERPREDRHGRRARER